MLTINPNSASAHFSLGYVYRYAGMLEESEKEYDTALTIDPGNLRFRSAGFTYVCLGKYEKAIEAFNLDRGSSLALCEIADIFFRQGKKVEAIETYNILLTQERSGVFWHFGVAGKAIIEGKTNKAGSVIIELEQANPTDAEIWFTIAEFYGLLGDEVGSARTLEKGVDRGYFNYPFMLSNSFFDPVRSSSEFQRVLARAKAKHEAFKNKIFIR